MAFRYNPMYVILLPFLGMYIVARLIDWILTGGNHVDQKINQKGGVRNREKYSDLSIYIACAGGILKNKIRETKFFQILFK